MSALELTLMIFYLVAMWGYGHFCYVQGVLDRDEGIGSSPVRRALRFGRRFVDPGRAGQRRPATLHPARR